MTLTPAYGADYKSQKEVRAAFAADKDFVIADFNHPHSGRYCNRADLLKSTDSTVWIRYAKLRKIVQVDVK